MSAIGKILSVGSALESGHVCPFCARLGLGRSGELTPDEEKRLAFLKRTDEKTRIHEQAHSGKLGQYAVGQPHYNLEKGPDGKEYANGGETPTPPLSLTGNPQKDLDKLRAIREAALAPDEPSSQDYHVAAQADAMMREAQNRLSRMSTLSVFG